MSNDISMKKQYFKVFCNIFTRNSKQKEQVVSPAPLRCFSVIPFQLPQADPQELPLRSFQRQEAQQRARVPEFPGAR